MRLVTLLFPSPASSLHPLGSPSLAHTQPLLLYQMRKMGLAKMNRPPLPSLHLLPPLHSSFLKLPPRFSHTQCVGRCCYHEWGNSFWAQGYKAITLFGVLHGKSFVKPRNKLCFRLGAWIWILLHRNQTWEDKQGHLSQCFPTGIVEQKRRFEYAPQFPKAGLSIPQPIFITGHKQQHCLVLGSSVPREDHCTSSTVLLDLSLLVPG